MDHLDITPNPCPFEDVSRTVGPYLRDYLQRRGRSQTGLGLSLEPSIGGSHTFHVGDMDTIDFFTPVQPRMNMSMTITMDLSQALPGCSLEGAIVQLIAHVPREEVIYFQTCYDTVAMEDVYALLPNLRGLHFDRMFLPLAFPELDLGGGGEILPSLQFVFLDQVVVDDADWRPLTTFLDRRASSGNQLHTLVIAGGSPPWQELERVIRVYKHI